eukprot:m.63291 g.63291  ORF g.63291 m.63291 type:complete len:992 (+) comp11573_c0_seq1:115-3090(+)
MKDGAFIAMGTEQKHILSCALCLLAFAHLLAYIDGDFIRRGGGALPQRALMKDVLESKWEVCNARVFEIIGRKLGLAKLVCDESSDESCYPTMFDLPVIQIEEGSDNWKRFNCKLDNLAKWDAKFLARNISFGSVASDGKTFLHAAVTLPSIVAANLRNIVRHGQGWLENPYRTDPRQAVSDMLEERILSKIEVLIENHPWMVTAKDLIGLTPLHIAALEGSVKTCSLLIKAKADVNAQEAQGQTPLHYAATFGSIEIIDILISNGANRQLPDKYGKSFDDYISVPGGGVGPDVALEKYNIKQRVPITENIDEDNSDNACDPTGGWNVGSPTKEDLANEKCDIDRRTTLTPQEWYKDYYLQGRVVAIRGALPLAERCTMEKSKAKTNKVLNQPYNCGATAYPGITLQESCPSMCTLDTLDRGEQCFQQTAARNITYSPTSVRAHVGVINDKAPRDAEWAKILTKRFHPATAPFPWLCTAFIKAGNKQLFMSGKYGGATMHFHSAAYNALYFGYKRWYLLPPRYAELSGLPVKQYIDDAAVRGVKTSQCLQEPGDIFLLPRSFGHATYNPYGFATGIGMLYNDVRSEAALVVHDEARRNAQAKDWRNSQNQNIAMRGFAQIFGSGDPFDLKAARAKEAKRQARQDAPAGQSRLMAERRKKIEYLNSVMSGFFDENGKRILEENLAKKNGKRGKLNKKNKKKNKRNKAKKNTIPPQSDVEEKVESVAIAHSRSRREAPVVTEPASKICTRLIAFVHINKAGGTAMLSNLDKCCSDRSIKMVYKANLRKVGLPPNFFFHATAYRQKELVGEDVWKNSFKFALVRNPWSRQVSMFHFLVEGQCGRESRNKMDRCQKRFLPLNGNWITDHEQAAAKFRHWVKQLDEAFPVGSSTNYLFGSMSHGNDENTWFNASQLSWLVDNSGAILVDKIVKLEDLSTEWPHLVESMCAPLIEASHKNPSSHLHYSKYYDEETKAIVARHMAPDIRYFKYEFEEQ